jgi:hypothetical protein
MGDKQSDSFERFEPVVGGLYLPRTFVTPYNLYGIEKTIIISYSKFVDSTTDKAFNITLGNKEPPMLLFIGSIREITTKFSRNYNHLFYCEQVRYNFLLEKSIIYTVLDKQFSFGHFFLRP